MREPLLGYKIMFEFDMPDGTKNGGITSVPDALYMIWKIYTGHKGSNLVIKDETFYKDSDELPEKAQTPERTSEEEL